MPATVLAVKSDMPSPGRKLRRISRRCWQRPRSKLLLSRGNRCNDSAESPRAWRCKVTWGYGPTLGHAGRPGAPVRRRAPASWSAGPCRAPTWRSAWRPSWRSAWRREAAEESYLSEMIAEMLGVNLTTTKGEGPRAGGLRLFSCLQQKDMSVRAFVWKHTPPKRKDSWADTPQIRSRSTNRKLVSSFC